MQAAAAGRCTLARLPIMAELAEQAVPASVGQDRQDMAPPRQAELQTGAAAVAVQIKAFTKILAAAAQVLSSFGI